MKMKVDWPDIPHLTQEQKNEILTVKINKEWIITKDNELKLNINFIYLSDKPKIKVIKKG